MNKIIEFGTAAFLVKDILAVSLENRGVEVTLKNTGDSVSFTEPFDDTENAIKFYNDFLNKWKEAIEEQPPVLN